MEPDDQSPSGNQPGEPRGPHGDTVAVALLVGLFFASAVVYAMLGRLAHVPLLSPDEFLYGHLARSIADGQGLTWRGDPVHLRSPLYAYLLAPAWKLHSELSAYNTAKTIGAVCASATVIPVWLLARRFVSPMLALVPAVLCVGGALMTVTAGILTENFAFPLATASLSAMVLTILRPEARWGWVALAMALVGTLARAQLAVLVPIFLLAVAAEGLAHPAQLRERLLAHRAVIAVLGALTTGGVILVLASPETALGIYRDLNGASPGFGRVLAGAKDQLAALIVAAGILPVVVVLAASRARAWQNDPELRALLVVTWSASLLFVVQSAWFNASIGLHWSIERYVMYAVPLVLVTMVVSLARSVVTARAFVLASIAVVPILASVPAVRQVIEEPSLFGFNYRAGDVLGTSVSTGLALTAWLVVLCLLAAGILRRRSLSVRSVALAISTIVLVAFIGTSIATWRIRDARSQPFRDRLPADVSWLEHESGGPVARFVSNSNSVTGEFLEFFNRGIDQVYISEVRPPYGRPSLGGRVCTWSEALTGALTFDPRCGKPPHRFLFDDDAASITFYDQRLVTAHPGVGRVVTTPLNGPTRPLAVIVPPCSRPIVAADPGGRGTVGTPLPKSCGGAISGQMVLERAGMLVLHLRGGDADRHIQVTPTRVDLIPAHVLTTVDIPSPRGAFALLLRTDWSAPPPHEPELVSAELVQGQERTSLIYP